MFEVVLVPTDVRQSRYVVLKLSNPKSAGTKARPYGVHLRTGAQSVNKVPAWGRYATEAEAVAALNHMVPVDGSAHEVSDAGQFYR